MDDQPKSILKNPRAIFTRLFKIALILSPVSYAVFALLVGNWFPFATDEESIRHIVQWLILLFVGISITFLLSLLSLKGPRGLLLWLIPFTLVFIMVYANGDVPGLVKNYLGLPAYALFFSLFITLALLLAVKFFRWVLQARNFKKFLFGCACLATLIALFYAEEDWRGRRAWKNCRQQLEAGGVQLDLAAFIPKPVPDDQNFAATPVVKSWFVEVDRTVFTNTTERFAKNWEDNYAKAFEKMPAPKDRSIRHFSDLAGWGMAFDALRSGNFSAKEYDSGRLDPASRAAAVPSILAGLKTNEVVLAELRDASTRPYSRYPIFYDLDNPPGIFLPHLINVRDTCRRLQLRACAELAAGRSESALADVKLMLYLADSIKTEPFFISLLVRVACVQIAVQPVWEGLATHAWSDAQLQEIQKQLQSFDFLPELKSDFEGDQADGVLMADLIPKKGLGWLVTMLGGDSPMSLSGKFANWCGGFVPRGWYDLEKVNYCRLHQSQLEGIFDTASGKISPGRTAANAKALNEEISSGRLGRTAGSFFHHEFIAALRLPSLDNLILKIAQAQTAVNEAAIACALERYRLANGQFPADLEPLAPKFISSLPNDVLSGEPYKYRRTEDGQFILYSVGWNEKDEGGTPGKTLFDDKQGDWVWSYPQK